MTQIKPKVVVVLANLMDQEGRLNDETKGRVAMGAKLAEEHDAREVMFMGWDYREDSTLPISEAMRTYAMETGTYPDVPLHCNHGSRDTVGDAVLASMDYQAERSDVKLLVATSDYHADRTRRIFEFIWNADVRVFGAPTPNAQSRIEAELKSIDAFENTFQGIAAGDLRSIIQRLATKHPFYNGSAFPDRPFDVSHYSRGLVP